MARLRVYVDAFNVYYGALKNRGPGYKWLDVAALVDRRFPGHAIEGVVYCTARVSDPETNARQDAYLRALEARGAEIVEGTYKMREKRGRLIRPASMRAPGTVTIKSPEEKGSDVNLASRLLIDGFQGLYDQAVVISMDTDLLLPIEYVNRTMDKPVLLLVNHDRAVSAGERQRTHTPVDLKKVCRVVKSYKDADVVASQLPDPVVGPGGIQIHRPSHW